MRSWSWGGFLSPLVGILVAGLILLAWREWSTWVEVRNFVVPIMAAQRAQATQAPRPAPSASPAEPSK